MADETNPIKDVTALRNLALALNLNPERYRSSKDGSGFLLQRVWCPPAAPEVRYRQDTLLAATFAPGGSNNEIFAVGGDGQLLFWKEGANCRPSDRYLRSRNRTDNRSCNLALPPSALNGQWLFIIPPTLASAANAEAAAQGPPQQGPAEEEVMASGALAKSRSGDGRCRIGHTSLRARTWNFSGFEVPACSTLSGLPNQTGLSLSMRA